MARTYLYFEVATLVARANAAAAAAQATTAPTNPRSNATITKPILTPAQVSRFAHEVATAPARAPHERNPLNSCASVLGDRNIQHSSFHHNEASCSVLQWNRRQPWSWRTLRLSSGAQALQIYKGSS